MYLWVIGCWTFVAGLCAGFNLFDIDLHEMSLKIPIAEYRQCAFRGSWNWLE